MLDQWQIRLPHLPDPLSPPFVHHTATQMPMTLLFIDGILVGKQLGARTSDELYAWVNHEGHKDYKD
jgi:hypothetical protein